MALTTTTLSSQVAVTDKSIVVASATGFAAGNLIRIDNEVMRVVQTYVSGTTIGVLRGKGGSQQAAHVASANVVTGLASDFPDSPAGSDLATAYQRLMPVDLTSYSASGAIAFPLQGLNIAIINGTSNLAMTLANPTKEMDGRMLLIAGGGKSQTTVDYTAGFGNAGGSYDRLTAPAGGQVCALCVAVNGFWLLVGPVTGTLTSVGFAIA